jgi:Uma2 family endonuclease
MTTALLPPPAAVAPPLARDDEPLFEIIDGRRVELPPMSAYAARIAFRLGRRLGDYGEQRELGEAAVETLFHLALPVDRNRRPDVAFVSYERWPRGRPMPEAGNAWDVVPDVAIEVVSPNDLAEDVMEKLDEYFRAGVRLAWVIYPRTRIVLVFEALNRVRALTRSDELDGGEVLPGFRLPLADLLPPPQQENGGTPGQP